MNSDFIKTYDESELLHQLKQGSEFAFTQIFNHYRSRIYTVALSYLKSSALAEEIVQDVFLKIWLKRTELEHILRFDAYLITMSKNLIFDRLKKIAYEVDAQTTLKEQDDFINDAEYRIREHQCQQLVEEAMNLLPPQQKIIYHLARTEGLSHEQIAEKMQLSRLTVKTHMARALKFVRSFITARLNTFSFSPFLSALIFLH